MNNKALVSILVPVYNVEQYIERCARSLFEQTYDNIEYIFVDDCSTDGSLSVLRKLIKEYPQRAPHVQVFTFLENKGLPSVRNFLVDHCETDWLMHVDSDDWIELDLVEQLVMKQQEADADLVVSGIVRHMPQYDESRRNLDFGQKSDYLKLLFTDGAWVHIWGILIRRKLYTDNDIHVSTTINHAEDLRVVYRLMYYANGICATRKDGYHYFCKNPNSKGAINPCKVLDRGSGVIDALEELRPFVAKNMPDYLELYDTKICMVQYSFFLHLSLLYGNKELHRLASEKHRHIVRRYPSIYSCSVKDQITREIKYHYWIAIPLLKCKALIRKNINKIRKQYNTSKW